MALAAWAGGVQAGARLRAQGTGAASKFDDASMALLSLLLGFTFAMSMNWHNDRRLAAIADANSIGDFYTCASLLSEPNRSKLQSLIRDYAQYRLDMALSPPTVEEFNRSLDKFDDMHGEMTEIVRSELDKGTPIAVPLTNTLNALTSNNASRLAAVRTRLPDSIILLLFIATGAAIFLVGREQGFSGHSERVGTVIFTVLVGVAVYVILDLNRPDIGYIRVSQEPFQRLIQTMSK